MDSIGFRSKEVCKRRILGFSKNEKVLTCNKWVLMGLSGAVNPGGVQIRTLLNLHSLALDLILAGQFELIFSLGRCIWVGHLRNLGWFSGCFFGVRVGVRQNDSEHQASAAVLGPVVASEDVALQEVADALEAAANGECAQCIFAHPLH